jgi:hypothetical protein
MISRIMARAPRAGRHVLRSFQLRMAGSVAVAAALTVGGIAALEGASPSLAVFALAAPHSALGVRSPTAKFGTAEIPNSNIMRIYEEFDFSVGPDLSTNSGTGAAYELQLPTSASAEDARIAAIFGVSGTPVDTNNDGQDFTVTDSSGDYVDYETYDTVPQWSYSVAIPQGADTSSTTSDGTTVPMPSQSTVNGDVQNYLSQLGYGYQVSDPQFSTSNNVVTSPGQATVTTNEEQATYSVTVNGQVTDQSLDFTVDQNNNVVSADGPAFSAEPAVNYPLQSPAAGVEVLEAQQQANIAQITASGQSSGPGSSTTPLTGSSGSSPATPPSTAVTNDTRTANRRRHTGRRDDLVPDVPTDRRLGVDVADLQLHRTGHQRRRLVLHGNLVHHRRRPDLHPSIHLVIRRYQSRRAHPLLITSEMSVDEADAVSTRTDVSTQPNPAL